VTSYVILHNTELQYAAFDTTGKHFAFHTHIPMLTCWWWCVGCHQIGLRSIGEYRENHRQVLIS